MHRDRDMAGRQTDNAAGRIDAGNLLIRRRPAQVSVNREITRRCPPAQLQRIAHDELAGCEVQIDLGDIGGIGAGQRDRTQQGQQKKSKSRCHANFRQ
jgi:hypothetical protein